MDDKLKEYYNSPEWKQKAKRIKSERNYTCEICGNHILLEVVTILGNSEHPSWSIPEIERFAETIFERLGDQDKLIELHHKTYKNVYNENEDDLACLCRPCHVLCTENSDQTSHNGGWQKTQMQVQKLLGKINNRPDGKKEFAPTFNPLALLEHGVENVDEIKPYLGQKGYVEDYYAHTTNDNGVGIE